MLSLDENVVKDENRLLFLLASLCLESYAVASSDPDVGVFIVIVGSAAAAAITFGFFALIYLRFCNAIPNFKIYETDHQLSTVLAHQLIFFQHDNQVWDGRYAHDVYRACALHISKSYG